MQFGESTPLTPFPLLIGPEDLNTGANASNWISLQNYRGGYIVISLGDVAGGTAAVTLDQATDSAGTGTKTLAFTKYYQNGQSFAISGQSGTFAVAETVTGGTSGNTAYVVKISSDTLWMVLLTGTTTWTTTETLTGGTSGATATLTGTGTDEDMLLELTAAASTFSTLAIVFGQYVIPVDDTMLDGDNDFTHFQLDIAQAGVGPTEGCAIFVPFKPRFMTYPQQTLIDAQKNS